MKRFYLGLLCGLIIAFSLMWLLPRMHDSLTRIDRQIAHRYERITLDMPFTEVSQIMNSDGKRSTEFDLAQYGGYEIEYAAAARSGAKYFVTWRNGIDWAYTVNFDGQDRVVYKAKGTS